MSTPRHAIDRNSPEPFYLQLAALIEAGIDNGTYREGTRLPGESELCRTHDLARSTVRETLRTLEERRRIRLVPRRGAFVTGPGEGGWGLQVAAGFFEGEVDHNQRQVETRVLEAALAPASPEAAQALGLKPDEPAFVFRRLRRLDGRIAVYSINHLPAALEPVILNSRAMASDGSLNLVLQSAGYAIHGARRSVEAVAAPPEIAAMLEVAPQSPLLLITSVSWARGGQAFDYYTSWVRTDVVKVTVEASAGPE
ncbi:GntR family transcriptional regulator [Aestuariivirga sp.]|uniref:GntR family transcriptional regulator n=1 Tax=Aestuariivirga sp. TaxID=2650926 RepID=UPI0039E349EB